MAKLHRHVRGRIALVALPHAPTHCKRKRVDLSEINAFQIIESELRSAEQLPGVNVSRQSTRRHPAQIVNASGVGTAIHSRPVGRSRKRITALRRWSVLASSIFLDRVSDQRTTGSANCCSDRRATGTTTGQAANDCAGTGTGRGALPSRRVTRIKRECSECSAANNGEKFLAHMIASSAH